MVAGSGEFVETLGAYVPAFVARRLATDPTSIAVPMAQLTEGVCLFVDVAGFTQLTEELARLGAVGAEKMANILNETFEPLLATCAAHGGEVVDFAGDAIFVIWWAPDDGMDEAALRATQCAFALQAAIDVQPETDHRDVSVKISLTGGELSLLHIGGAGGRKHSMVAGADNPPISV